MIGRTYLKRGKPVVGLKRWGAPKRVPCPEPIAWILDEPAFGPRNVLVLRQDGSRVVRPFRGLRKTEEADRA